MRPTTSSMIAYHFRNKKNDDHGIVIVGARVLAFYSLRGI